jgi:hypothetical protein
MFATMVRESGILYHSIPLDCANSIARLELYSPAFSDSFDGIAAIFIATARQKFVKN